MPDRPPSYTDDEVEAIFRRALERQQAREDGFGREELVAAGREVGLDEHALERAVREIEEERSEEELRLAVKRKQRDKWLRHLATYLVIAGGFLGMHALGFVGAWAIWMAFGWGMGVAMHTFSTLRGPTEEQVEKERDRRNRKARRAAKARARAERRRERDEARRRRARGQHRRGEVEAELDRVIEDGVTLLLGAAAKKLREATGQLEGDARPQGDFGRYVARKKAEARGEVPRGETEETVQNRPARVRVAANEDAEAVTEDAEVERSTRRRRGR